MSSGSMKGKQVLHKLWLGPEDLSSVCLDRLDVTTKLLLTRPRMERHMFTIALLRIENNASCQQLHKIALELNVCLDI